MTAAQAIDWTALVALATKARDRAYAPYSRFRVGAALVADDGVVYAGCNVENASFGATICAERVAASSAVAAGARKILAVAVVGGDVVPASPCGICRQFLRELAASGDVVVSMTSASGASRTATLDELLPYAFGPESLGVREPDR